MQSSLQIQTLASGHTRCRMLMQTCPTEHWSWCSQTWMIGCVMPFKLRSLNLCVCRLVIWFSCQTRYWIKLFNLRVQLFVTFLVFASSFQPYAKLLIFAQSFHIQSGSLISFSMQGHWAISPGISWREACTIPSTWRWNLNLCGALWYTYHYYLVSLAMWS